LLVQHKEWKGQQVGGCPPRYGTVLFLEPVVPDSTFDVGKNECRAKEEASDEFSLLATGGLCQNHPFDELPLEKLCFRHLMDVSFGEDDVVC
jgi:hypothetical protein